MASGEAVKGTIVKKEAPEVVDRGTQTLPRPLMNPNYRAFKAEFLGQQPNDFDKFLANKLKKLMDNVELTQFDDKIGKQLTKALGNAREKCKQKVCIRPNTSNEDKLDKRRTRSRDTYVTCVQYSEVSDLLDQSVQQLPNPNNDEEDGYSEDDDFSEDDEDDFSDDEPNRQDRNQVDNLPSPEKLQRASSGMRGVKKMSKKLGLFIHSEQEVIFPLLKELLNLLKPLKLCQFTEPPVYDKTKSTEEFCISIDFYTSAVIKFCVHYLNNPRPFPSNDCLLLLGYVLQLSLMIVAGRNVADWATPNDLLNEKDWRNWKNHLIVMISFAALLTALLMLAKLCKRKWKRFKYQFVVVLKSEFGRYKDLGDLIFSSFL